MKIPVFSQLAELPDQAPPRRPKTPRNGGRPRSIPDSVVAAIRWDWECGQMRLAALKAKWRESASATAVENIAHGRMRPEIKAARDVS